MCALEVYVYYMLSGGGQGVVRFHGTGVTKPSDMGAGD